MIEILYKMIAFGLKLRTAEFLLVDWFLCFPITYIKTLSQSSHSTCSDFY